jgi:catechol 2,3-dioxygenase-like lactoylglutathione lyase family enzyme
MAIIRMDHFTILTTDAAKTAAFYGEILGFKPGPRPAFAFPGAWLYHGDRAVLHVIEKPEIPSSAGVLDHMAFWGEGLAEYVAKLKSKGIKYDLRRLPKGGVGEGMWQLFFFDPSNARVEIDFAASEPGPSDG